MSRRYSQSRCASTESCPAFKVSLRIHAVSPQHSLSSFLRIFTTILSGVWIRRTDKVGWLCWLCWGLTSQSTIFQSCRDGAIASWEINQYFRGVKCLAQGHNTAAVGLEPRTSRSRVRHSTTEPLRSPEQIRVFDDNGRIIFVSSP